MLDVFIESSQLVSPYTFSAQQIADRKGDELAFLTALFRDPKTRFLAVDIDNVMMGFLCYERNMPTWSEVLQFNTIPTLDYKIGSHLFKAMCNDTPEEDCIWVSSTEQGFGAYQTYGMLGNRNFMWLTQDRVQEWRECKDGMFPRHGTLKRKQALARLPGHA